MPMPFHMTVEGTNQGNIEGSCDQQGREGTILCQAYIHEISIPRDVQSGLPVGKRVHHPATVTKVFDKSSPKLAQALTSGEQVDVELKWYRIDPTGVDYPLYQRDNFRDDQAPLTEAIYHCPDQEIKGYCCRKGNFSFAVRELCNK